MIKLTNKNVTVAVRFVHTGGLNVENKKVQLSRDFNLTGG